MEALIANPSPVPFSFISVVPVLAISFTASSEVVLSLHLGPLTDSVWSALGANELGTSLVFLLEVITRLLLFGISLTHRR